MHIKPASHCAISCGAMLHRRRLPDIAQCAGVCDTTAGDFSTIASNRFASRDFEHVQNLSQATQDRSTSQLQCPKNFRGRGEIGGDVTGEATFI